MPVTLEQLARLLKERAEIDVTNRVNSWSDAFKMLAECKEACDQGRLHEADAGKSGKAGKAARFYTQLVIEDEELVPEAPPQLHNEDDKKNTEDGKARRIGKHLENEFLNVFQRGMAHIEAWAKSESPLEYVRYLLGTSKSTTAKKVDLLLRMLGSDGVGGCLLRRNRALEEAHFNMASLSMAIRALPISDRQARADHDFTSSSAASTRAAASETATPFPMPKASAKKKLQLFANVDDLLDDEGGLGEEPEPKRARVDIEQEWQLELELDHDVESQIPKYANADLYDFIDMTLLPDVESARQEAWANAKAVSSSAAFGRGSSSSSSAANPNAGSFFDRDFATIPGFFPEGDLDMDFDETQRENDGLDREEFLHQLNANVNIGTKVTQINEQRALEHLQRAGGNTSFHILRNIDTAAEARTTLNTKQKHQEALCHLWRRFSERCEELAADLYDVRNSEKVNAFSGNMIDEFRTGQPLASPYTLKERPVLVVRIAPDGTNMRQGNILNVEAFSVRSIFRLVAGDEGELVLFDCVPRSEPHASGWRNVLNDVCTILKNLMIPMPGSTAEHYIADPVVLYSIATDAGSDELKAMRVLRHISDACNEMRQWQLRHVDGKDLDEKNASSSSGTSSSSFFDECMRDYDEPDNRARTSFKNERAGENWKTTARRTADQGRILLETYIIQYTCMMHQYHLLVGLVVSTAGVIWNSIDHWTTGVRHDDGGIHKKSLTNLLSALTRSTHLWVDEDENAKIPSYVSNRWLSLAETLDAMHDLKHDVIRTVQEIEITSRKPENQPTVRDAKHAVSSDSFWNMCHALRSAIKPVQRQSARLLAFSPLLRTDAKVSEMARERPRPLTARALDSIMKTFFITETVEGHHRQRGGLLLLVMEQGLIQRERQLWKFPYMMMRFQDTSGEVEHYNEILEHQIDVMGGKASSSSCKAQIEPHEAKSMGRRAASAFLAQDKAGIKDKFLRYIYDAFYWEIANFADGKTKFLPKKLAVILDPLQPASDAQTTFTERMQSTTNNLMKEAPAMKAFRLGVRTLIRREKFMPWEEWQKCRVSKKALHDGRTTSAKERLEDEDLDVEWGQDLLQPTFDRAYRVAKLHAKAFGVADLSGKDLDLLDDPVPESTCLWFDVPDLQLQLNLGEKVKGLETVYPGVLIRRKGLQEGAGVFLVITTSTAKGVGEKRGALLQLKAYEIFAGENRTRRYKVCRDHHATWSISHWVLNPKKASANVRWFRFEVNEAGELYWNKNGNLSLKADSKRWVSRQLDYHQAFQDRTHERDYDAEQQQRDNPGGHARQNKDKEVRWKSGKYHWATMMPERQRMPEVDKYYVIFRPEAGTWSLTLPLAYREKVLGEGLTSDQTKAITKTTPRGLLDRTSVRNARKKMCQEVCVVLGIKYVEPNEADEQAAYQEVLKYINDTITADEWDEDEGFAAFI
eukprot:g16974.t1